VKRQNRSILLHLISPVVSKILIKLWTFYLTWRKTEHCLWRMMPGTQVSEEVDIDELRIGVLLDDLH
jgi:hypothetical protein